MSALSGNLVNLPMHWSIADTRVGGQPNCGAEEALMAPAECIRQSALLEYLSWPGAPWDRKGRKV